ncbi:MAG: SPOR domain-containing protein [Steroidobacteraceae bacterium]
MTQPRTLSRDYKHVKRYTPGGQPVNAWVGFGGGLALGLTVALGVFMHYRDQPPAQPTAAAEPAPASAQASEEAPVVPDNAQDLTFYDDLPRQEVEVPVADRGRKDAGASVLPTGDIVLQAGAFKQVAEAEKLQARLAQYGVDSKIQRYALQDETWFRVRIGPISTVQELETTRAKLAEAEIEATPVTPGAPSPPP